MNKAIKTLGTAILVMLLTTALFAGGGGEEGGHHGFDWMGFLGKLFNSVVLFGGLIFLLRKPIINLLTQKSLDVKNDILQREEDLKTTSGQLEEIRKRLEKIEAEVSGMKQAAEAGGKEEQKRIEELGAKEAQRILDMTDAEIANKIENSVRNLKARIADLTIDHFKQDIQKQLDKNAHEKIIEKNIEISGDIIERE
jgi:F0F1-type ATP synthase membrane subunit b/b'